MYIYFEIQLFRYLGLKSNKVKAIQVLLCEKKDTMPAAVANFKFLTSEISAINLQKRNKFAK